MIGNLPKGFEMREGIVPVAVNANFSSSSDAGLVILAMGKAYWMLLYVRFYVLCVAESDLAADQSRVGSARPLTRT